jgi:hypothetical protein
MLWKNIVAIRAGQGIQHGRMTASTTLRNSVAYGGFDWKSPFQNFQDGGNQFEGAENYTVKNNIFLGGGKGGHTFGVNKKDPIEDARQPGTMTWDNNFLAWSRGNLAIWGGNEHDGVTSITIQNSYFYKWGAGNVAELWPNEDLSNISIIEYRIDPVGGVTFTFRNNTYGTSFTEISRNNNVDLTNNTQSAYVAPQFRNAMGTGLYNPTKDANGFITGFSDSIVFGDDFDYTRIERYTNILGSDPAFTPSNTNKLTPAEWEVGDIVQYWNGERQTRYYICIQYEKSSTDNRPPTSDFDDSNAYWRVLRWKMADGTYSYRPPDDWRLVKGSFYETKGIGLDITDFTPRGPLGRGGIVLDRGTY